MKSSNLALHNIKLIEHSNILALIGVISFLINISLSSLYISALIFGVLIGIFLGLCLPWLWKKEFSFTNSFVTIIAVVTASIYLNKTVDLYACFQMLSSLTFTSGLIWYVQKSKLIKYLMA